MARCAPPLPFSLSRKSEPPSSLFEVGAPRPRAMRLRLFEPKPIDGRTVVLFGLLNGTSIGLLNLSLGFNSIGFYQMTKLVIIPFTVLLETLFLNKKFRSENPAFPHDEDPAGEPPPSSPQSTDLKPGSPLPRSENPAFPHDEDPAGEPPPSSPQSTYLKPGSPLPRSENPASDEALAGRPWLLHLSIVKPAAANPVSIVKPAMANPASIVSCIADGVLDLSARP